MNGRSLLVRLAALFRRGRAEHDLDEEVRYHLEAEAERNIARGMSPADAHDAARRAFGNPGLVREEMRDAWRLGWLQHLGQDVRFALRVFRGAPAFSATVVGTIAIALGLNTAVFALFDAYVLRPIAVRDPYSLYQVLRQGRGTHPDFSQPQLDEMRALPVISQVFGYHPLFTFHDEEPFLGAIVTGEYFSDLGGSAVLGRVLVPDDAAVPGTGAVMVLSHRVWRSRFAADSGVIGRTISVRSQPFEIVGVASPTFDGLGAVRPDFWIPTSMLDRIVAHDPNSIDPPGRLRVVVRLKPDVSVAQATAVLSDWVRRNGAARADSARDSTAVLLSVASSIPLTGETMVVFLPVMVAFGLVMLIACANVANVMLARGVARQREIGIRLALGAGRARLIRQLVTEALLLALPAAALGYVLSRIAITGGTQLMLASMPGEFVTVISARLVDVQANRNVFLFMLLATLAATTLFGLVPALQATRPDVVRASRGDFDAGTRTGRLRGALVVLQVTVSVLLLVCTGVLLQGARRASAVPTGLRTADLVQLMVQDSGRAAAIAQLQREPVVRAVTSAYEAPMDGTLPAFSVAADTAATGRRVYWNLVSPSYFDVFGIGIERGRGFTEAEAREGGSVVIVSRALAEELWPGRDAIGRRVRLELPPDPGSRFAGFSSALVVGIAANTVAGWVGTGSETPIAYYPAPLDAPGARLYVRVAGDPVALRHELSRDLDGAAPGTVEDIHSVREILAAQLWPFRASYWISAAIGLVALVLTLTGIYGVMSYLVAQRTREIGIRMALGAGAPAVVRMVLGESARMAAAGIVIGLLLAGGLSLLFASALYLIDAFDPLGYLIGVSVVAAACLAGALVPSRRAARVDPLLALRAD